MFFLAMSKLENDQEIKLFVCPSSRDMAGKKYTPFQSETFSCRKNSQIFFLTSFLCRLRAPGLSFNACFKYSSSVHGSWSIFKLKLKSRTTQIENGENTSSAVSRGVATGGNGGSGPPLLFWTSFLILSKPGRNVCVVCVGITLSSYTQDVRVLGIRTPPPPH